MINFKVWWQAAKAGYKALFWRKSAGEKNSSSKRRGASTFWPLVVFLERSKQNRWCVLNTFIHNVYNFCEIFGPNFRSLQTLDYFGLLMVLTGDKFGRQLILPDCFSPKMSLKSEYKYTQYENKNTEERIAHGLFFVFGLLSLFSNQRISQRIKILWLC